MQAWSCKTRYPGPGRPFVFELGLILRILQCFVPSIGQSIPMCVAPKQVERVLAIVLADGEAAGRTEHHAAHELFRIGCEAVTLVDPRVADDARTADDLGTVKHVG